MSSFLSEAKIFQLGLVSHRVLEMSSEMSTVNYDVFLSFKGPDTRQGFTDVLYDRMVTAGIRVFKDNNELGVGDRIETILQAIDNSQLCVPLFSETFASSKWCLREVTRMVHLKKTIVPIFCNVSSDDVKFKTPKYMKSMEEHKSKYKKEEVEEWKGALKAAAQYKGRELLNKSYTEFCKEFICEVLKKLGPRPKFEVDDLVGVDKQFKRLQELLDLNSADVRYIGIHGMGGIGKTSLAKDFFNRFSASFYRYDFIENVREKSMDVNGLGNLEEKVRGKLGPSLYEKKVLVVLDDVDKSEQIEKLVGKSSRFGLGSRIVVTTRDKSVLEKCKALKSEEVFCLEMRVLETRDALRLFSRCAFMKDSPPLDFEKLSQEAVSTTGNLPLALEVMGSLLRNEKGEVWEDTIARSKVVPMKDVKDRLKISYDKLEKEKQHIFLDIACILNGDEKSEAMSMWMACKFYPYEGLAVLESRSLIKVEEDDDIWMHDLLRDLGRDIVLGESDSPYERSRLWEHDEALEVLMSKKGTVKVQALCLNHRSNDITLKRKHLKKFKNLRLLWMGGAKLEGEMGNILPKLRWLRWRAPAELEASNFRLPNLVTLELSDSDIGDSWGGWRLLQGAKNLKDLILRQCLNLTRTPDFVEHMNIERLDLNGCKNLVMVHDSIGNLKCLKRLELEDTKVVRLPESVGALESLDYLDLSCSGIAELPDSIGWLTKLKWLELLYCSTLKALPPSIGNIKSLIELSLLGTAIEALPDSIGSLENLKVLEVNNGRRTMKELPDSIGNLENLNVLYVSNGSLRGLPDSIGKLTKLERLHLSDCYTLKVLPRSIGNIKSLIELELQQTMIEELPDSIGSLENLKELDVRDGSLRGLPDSIGKLTKLEWLCLSDCYALKALPRSIGNIKSLIELRLRGTAIEELPDFIGSLEKLKVLYVDNCRLRGLPRSIVVLGMLKELRAKQNSQLEELPREIRSLSCLRILNVEECHRLQEIPKLPMSLHELCVESKVLKTIHDLSGLNNLLYLKLLGGNDVATSNLGAIERLSELESLDLHLGLRDDALWPSNFSHLSRLQTLELSCRNLKTPLQLPSSLVTLLLQDVNLETELCLSDLVNLTGLSLVEWSKNNRYESLGIEHLLSLHKLFVDGCHIVDGLHVPQNVRYLHIQNCEFLKKVPDLSCCKDLVDLKVSHCKMLTEISGLGELKYLSNLTIEDCISLERIEGLFKLQAKKLGKFKISRCRGVQDMLNIESFRREQAHRKGHLHLGQRARRVTTIIMKMRAVRMKMRGKYRQRILMPRYNSDCDPVWFSVD